MDRIAILDVGHGNCAVVCSQNETLVIDTGVGNSLLLFLAKEKIVHIDKILISHADADHIGGLIGIISSAEITISEVFLNSDAMKGSRLWKALVYELDKTAREGKLQFTVELTDLHIARHNITNFNVEILAPSAALAALGPGSTDKHNRQITTNTISSVIRVTFLEGGLSILFSADMDNTSLENILENGHDIAANVLVFPHHGGRPGSAYMEEFTRNVCSNSGAEFVIFSIGRGKHSTPNPAILETIRKHFPTVKVLCTQISQHCNADDKQIKYDHLTEVFSKGRDTMRSCAGTVVLSSGRIDGLIASDTTHKAFVREHIDMPMCLK
jgi:competence protein ComEC